MLKRKNQRKTEKELAKHFQEHRGDISTWSTQAVQSKVAKEPAVVFSVRFSPQEIKSLRKEADKRGVTISTYVRDAVLENSAPVGSTCIVWKASSDITAVVGYSSIPTGYRGTAVHPKCNFGIVAGGTTVDRKHTHQIIDSYNTIAAPVVDEPPLLTERSRRTEYAN
jgi:hypothetical protein